MYIQSLHTNATHRSSGAGSAPADDKRSRQVTYWRDKQVEEEQAKAAPAEQPGTVEVRDLSENNGK